MNVCSKCGNPVFDEGSWKVVALENRAIAHSLHKRLIKLQYIINHLMYSPTNGEFSFSDDDLIASGFNSIKELMEYTNEL